MAWCFWMFQWGYWKVMGEHLFIYSFIATFMFAALGDLLLCCITLPL